MEVFSKELHEDCTTLFQICLKSVGKSAVDPYLRKLY